MTEHEHVKAAHAECRAALRRLRQSIETKAAAAEEADAEATTDVEAVPVAIDPDREISAVNHREDLRTSLNTALDTASAILRRHAG